mmetsp:Transcript_97744/g.254754  ORF Transcript_97744/g.254754 Transcript_97744/m.254754 type:complete len:83 (-) Transcript_97744:68-316(-)
MVCPMKPLLVLLAAVGLSVYAGPAVVGAQGKRSTLAARAGWWMFLGIVFALHVDLLLSIGYTRCIFKIVVDMTSTCPFRSLA